MIYFDVRYEGEYIWEIKRYGSVRLVNKDGFSVCIKETINWFGRKNMNET